MFSENYSNIRILTIINLKLFFGKDEMTKLNGVTLFSQNFKRLPLLSDQRPDCHFCSAGRRCLFDIVDVFGHQKDVVIELYNI